MWPQATHHMLRQALQSKHFKRAGCRAQLPFLQEISACLIAVVLFTIIFREDRMQHPKACIFSQPRCTCCWWPRLRRHQQFRMLLSLSLWKIRFAPASVVPEPAARTSIIKHFCTCCASSYCIESTLSTSSSSWIQHRARIIQTQPTQHS